MTSFIMSKRATTTLPKERAQHVAALSAAAYGLNIMQSCASRLCRLAVGPTSPLSATILSILNTVRTAWNAQRRQSRVFPGRDNHGEGQSRLLCLLDSAYVLIYQAGQWAESAVRGGVLATIEAVPRQVQAALEEATAEDEHGTRCAAAKRAG